MPTIADPEMLNMAKGDGWQQTFSSANWIWGCHHCRPSLGAGAHIAVDITLVCSVESSVTFCLHPGMDMELGLSLGDANIELEPAFGQSDCFLSAANRPAETKYIWCTFETGNKTNNMFHFWSMNWDSIFCMLESTHQTHATSNVDLKLNSIFGDT